VKIPVNIKARGFSTQQSVINIIYVKLWWLPLSLQSDHETEIFWILDRKCVDGPDVKQS